MNWWHPLCALAVTACAAGGDVAATPTAESVRTDLTAALPLGSSAEQVAAVLNERGYTSDGPVDPNLSPRMGGRAGYELPAIIRDTGRRGLVRYDIAMLFLFDEERKLTSIEVKDVGTGP